MKRLDLVVGPNGAGKSSFVDLVLAAELPGVVFVNADLLAQQHWPEDPTGASYDAARMAADVRDKLIRGGHPFIAETVFSHPSKLDLITTANAADYEVHLHVVMVPEELAVARVATRVEGGGHPVPKAKIRSRYHRLWPLVADAVGLVHTATFWANDSRRPRQVALFHHGAANHADWPAWAPDALRNLPGPT